MKPTDDLKARLRRVPKVDALAHHSALATARLRIGDEALMSAAREVAARVRDEVMAGAEPPEIDVAALRVKERIDAMLGARMRRVINASGVLLHTNLGRAPLSKRAAQATAEAASGYGSLEIDLPSGGRGARGAFAERALEQLCGAEAALVVNNNAAGVLLVLTALARDKAVIVSRGELVEIGGGFRVPDVLARSGARMIEIGTTNKTRLEDYRAALDANDDAVAILSVHPGNFRMTGFVARPSLAELAELAEARGKLLIDDLGGGALIDLQEHAGLAGEPVARDRVQAGAHVVCFSCDKVLGGPQGGAIVGKRAIVERVRRDPLARALRLGPLPLAALEATLADYLAGDHAAIPALAMMHRTQDEVRARVSRWCEKLAARGIRAQRVDVDGRVGGGTFAEEPLPSAAAWIELDGKRADEIALRLRTGQPPVMPRIADDRLLLDGRTVLDGEDEELIAAVIAAMEG
jgi:L-seryl-tRNA(Ser) seleniumtransferase